MKTIARDASAFGGFGGYYGFNSLFMAHFIHQQPDQLKQNDVFLCVCSNMPWATLMTKVRRH